VTTGVRSGVGWIDQIIGFKIASSSYITMEMNMDKMELLEMNTDKMELLKAIKEMMETQFCSLAIQLKTLKEKLVARNAELDAHHERMMACLGKTDVTDLKANPEEMQSESEHREVPKEYAAVKPVRGRKKRHRGRHLAAGRRGEPKELAQGDCGSRRKLAAACRKVSCRARVAWHRRNIVREYIRAKVERGIQRVRTPM
jgi:hypothetical protein